MDTGPIILVLAPILAPLGDHYGFHPLHFGVLFVMNTIIGLATPPYGLNIFVGCAIGKIELEKVMRAILPFVAAEIGILFLCAYVPQIILFIPRAAGLIE
jgi:TRAP-type C4-dicarboxylate transport system permease large subunit